MSFPSPDSIKFASPSYQPSRLCVTFKILVSSGITPRCLFFLPRASDYCQCYHRWPWQNYSQSSSGSSDSSIIHDIFSPPLQPGFILILHSAYEVAACANSITYASFWDMLRGSEKKVFTPSAKSLPSTCLFSTYYTHGTEQCLFGEWWNEASGCA